MRLRAKLLSLVAVVILLCLLGITRPAQATASPYSAIGVTGETRWPAEYYQSLKIMNDWGIPIHDGCSPGDLCVTLSHYRAKDGNAGYSAIGGRHPTVELNDFYDNGNSMRREHLIIHELSHHAGLGHSDSCSTSMNPSIPACGNYVLGFTAEELRRIKEIWG